MKDLKLKKLRLLSMVNLINAIENSQSAIDSQYDDTDFWDKIHKDCQKRYSKEVAEFIIENQDEVKNNSVWSKIKNTFK